ncbi:MAG: hypothetical protein MJZ81_06625 [Bacteroidales bacterium]|nr:hypothetical protein [Bacteroidales bacterium]
MNTRNITRTYVPLNAVSVAWDSQYRMRAEKNVGRINAAYLILTVVSTLKAEIDDETEARGLVKGELKRWGRKYEETYDRFCLTLREAQIKENIPAFAADYEELDELVRDIANLERRTRICWGRLHTTVFNLLTLYQVMQEDLARSVATTHYYMRNLMALMGDLAKLSKKWLEALRASGFSQPKELPVGFEEFTTRVLDNIYKAMDDGQTVEYDDRADSCHDKAVGHRTVSAEADLNGH